MNDMRMIGNLFVIVGSSIIISGALALAVNILMHILLSCTSAPSSLGAELSCKIHSPVMIGLIKNLSNYLFILYFAIPLIALPFLLFGSLFRSLTIKKHPEARHSSEFIDTTAFYLSRIVVAIVLFLLAVAFWFISIPAGIYFVYKMRSFSLAFVKLKKAIVGIRHTSPHQDVPTRES